MSTTVEKNIPQEQESYEKLFESVNVLGQLCSTRNYKGSRTGSLNLTPRATFITDVLNYIQLDYTVESFKVENEAKDKTLIVEEVFRALEGLDYKSRVKAEVDITEEEGDYNFRFNLDNLQEQEIIRDVVPTYNNIVVKFDASEPTDESILFTAHHDIVNPNSDNCQDNSASVANLLDLARKIKEEQPELSKNVYIIFLDCEETGGRGAAHNAKMIKEGKYGEVTFIANSELTAVGDTIWMESSYNSLSTPYMEKAKELVDGIVDKRCPPSDAMYYRSNGIQQAICFGILPQEEAEAGFPSTWGLCHSSADVFNADGPSMENYVNFLFSLINA